MLFQEPDRFVRRLDGVFVASGVLIAPSQLEQHNGKFWLEPGRRRGSKLARDRQRILAGGDSAVQVTAVRQIPGAHAPADRERKAVAKEIRVHELAPDLGRPL